MPIHDLGLTTSEAKARLQKYGPNKLPEVPPPSDLSIVVDQLKSPLVYILIFAAIVTFLLGEYTDTTIIAVAVLINTELGFFQERRANRALHALKGLIHPQAEVIRDGNRLKIEASDITIGDVCIVKAGDKVPADGSFIETNRLFVTEAILTGESVAVSKEKGGNAFMGTIITSGNGMLVVEKVGRDTEIGKIALQVQEPYEDTPLKRQLIKFSSQLTILVVGLTVFVFIAGLVTGRDLVEIFTTSVALAVSAIPEGLLVGLTVVLAIGMQKILKNKGLVRNLVSAETLGGVTTICIDKTGTLTEGKMKVTEIFGDKIDIAKQAIIANDMDDPIVVTLWEWANKVLSNKDLKGENIDDYLNKHPRMDSIPFTSSARFFASLNKVSRDKQVIFVNGAPEFLLEWSNLSSDKQKVIRSKIDKLTSEGKRLVAMARKEVFGSKKKINPEDVKKDLEWVGLIAFSDPVRTGVKDALDKVKSAKVKLIVITGDYAQTAVSVLNEIGLEIKNENIILGRELEEISDTELRKRLLMGESLLFARTTPNQKLKIVKALKANNEVVAMMGDGVNDAPALKHADIGIVVGDASDVAKESADLVLLDSSFTTIVSAIEEGRGIFDNVRKIILYLMSDAFEEIVAVVASILVGLPLPITAAQILWINLVSDGFPHLALTVDPRAADIMKSAPRNPREPLVNSWMKKLILIVSLGGGITGLVLFTYFYKTTGDLMLAKSIAFAALGINSMFYIFSVRMLIRPAWKGNPFENKFLNVAVLGGIFLQIFPFFFSKTRELLDLRILSLGNWVLIFCTSLFMFIIIEVVKQIFSRHLASNIS